MTSILFLKETIYYNMSDGIISETKKDFPNFLLHFGNLDSLLRIFNKKMTLIADVVLSLRTAKNVVR